MTVRKLEAQPAIAVVDCGSTKVQRLVAIVNENNCHVCSIPLAKANDSDLAQFNGLVISGGPHLFTNHSTHKALVQQFEFIDTLKIPMLGVCLGHQALGLRNGSSVFLGAERRGTEAINTITKHELLHGLPPQFSMIEDHCEGITLPAGFQQLASSAHYEVEAMASTMHPHFGVQFHPEFSGNAGELIIRNFCTIVRHLYTESAN